MKKFLAGLIVGLVLATSVSVMADSPVVKLFVNGQEVKSDVPPQIIDGRTLVPARPIAEALGATVAWDPANRAVQISAQPPEPTEWLNIRDAAILGRWVGENMSDGVRLQFSGDRMDIQPAGATDFSVTTQQGHYVRVHATYLSQQTVIILSVSDLRAAGWLPAR